MRIPYFTFPREHGAGGCRGHTVKRAEGGERGGGRKSQPATRLGRDIPKRSAFARQQRVPGDADRDGLSDLRGLGFS